MYALMYVSKCSELLFENSEQFDVWSRSMANAA
jgi:hypothetical protein